MPIETQKVELIPVGGVNTSDNLSRLDPMEVSASANFLYEKRQVSTRCGLATIDFDGVITHKIVYLDSIDVDGLIYLISIDSVGNIFFTFGGVTTPITGAATSFDNADFGNATSIIGLVVIGNNTGGIITWDPAGTTYNINAAAPYRYISGHKGRAVACYQLVGGSSFTNPRIFAWSKPGDISIWSSTNGSAGQVALADVNDDITGVGVLHDLVVILRRYGIHLGFPTGTLPLPYDIQSFVLKGVGCFWPPSAAFSDEIAYFVGEDDVYAFDLQSITSIGYRIRDTLLPLLRAGVFYRGFVSRANTLNSQRLRYNLIPTGDLATADMPHFIYDVLDKTWSLQYYSIVPNWAFYYSTNFSPSFGFGIAFVNNSSTPVVSYWSDQVVPEQGASLSRYMGRVDSPDKDYLVEDILIRYRDVSDSATPVTVTLVGTGSAGVTTTAVTVDVGGTGDGRWKRIWLSRTSTNFRQSGNEFVLTLAVASGHNFIFDYISLLLTEQGDFRG